MMKIVRAEALLACDGDCPAEAIACARTAGILAARKAGELVPSGIDAPAGKIDIEIEAKAKTKEYDIRILVSVESNRAAPALTAAAIAAITLCESVGASVSTLRLAHSEPAPKPVRTIARRLAAARRKEPAAKPTALAGLVGAPPPRQGAADPRAHFRAFMAAHHLRATEWARSADVPAAEIYAYLTGRIAALPKKTAEKLAKAADVRVEDMFT